MASYDVYNYVYYLILIFEDIDKKIRNFHRKKKELELFLWIGGRVQVIL